MKTINRKLFRFWLLNSVLLISFQTKAAQCPELPTLNLETCGLYDYIAFGRFESAVNCKSQSATFTPIQIFKGDFSKEVEVLTPCDDNGLPVSKNEYWIIFGKQNNSLETQLSICSHSRQKFPSDAQDFNTAARGTSFDQNLEFLRANFTPKIDDKQELKARKYKKVDPIKIPILLGIGLAFMLCGTLVFKMMGKRKN